MPGPGTCIAGPCSWYGDHKCICADNAAYMVADRRPPPTRPAHWLPPSTKPAPVQPIPEKDEIRIILEAIRDRLTVSGQWIGPGVVTKILEDIISAEELLNNT